MRSVKGWWVKDKGGVIPDMTNSKDLYFELTACKDFLNNQGFQRRICDHQITWMGDVELIELFDPQPVQTQSAEWPPSVL